jgi:hypothetical protein
VSRLTYDDAQGFIGQKMDEGLAPRTVRPRRGLLVNVLNHALIKGLVPINVAALTQGPTLVAGEQRALTIDESKILLKALDGERLEALYLLRLITGIRPGGRQAPGRPGGHGGHGREVESDERYVWWERAIEAYPPYVDYQEATDRRIPVFVTTRK